MIHQEKWFDLIDKVQEHLGPDETKLCADILDLHAELTSDLLVYLGCTFSSNGGWTEVRLPGAAHATLIPDYYVELPHPKIRGTLATTVGERQAFDQGGNPGLAAFREYPGA